MAGRGPFTPEIAMMAFNYQKQMGTAQQGQQAMQQLQKPTVRNEEMAQLRPHTRASFSTHVIDLEKAVRLRAPDAIVTNVNDAFDLHSTTFDEACPHSAIRRYAQQKLKTDGLAISDYVLESIRLDVLTL